MARITRARSEPRTYLLSALTLFVALAATPAVADAQSGASTFATRDQLRERVAHLEQRLQNATLTEEGRRQVRSELARVESRLEGGDFHPGDVVTLEVWGSNELSGTFTVGNSTRLQLPSIAPVDLDGVLYSEAEAAIQEHLEQYLQDVRLTVRPMKRVAILGAVQSPGFYDLRPSASVSDALMAAGGPAQNAKLEELALRRGGTNVLAAADARTGEVQTMTLEELDIRRGDQFFVPQDTGGFGFREFAGLVGALGTIAWGVSSLF